MSLREEGELEGKTVAELDAMMQELMKGKSNFDEMSEDDTMRYIAICNRLRVTARTASKPSAAGGSSALKKRIRDERPLSDLLGF
jgi:hypothetical protein